jgi:hypothetical protein
MKPAVHVDVASLLVAVAGAKGGLSTWYLFPLCCCQIGGPEMSESELVRDMRWGVRRAIVESYRPGAFWWESVLLGQRLVRLVLLLL